VSIFKKNGHTQRPSIIIGGVKEMWCCNPVVAYSVANMIEACCFFSIPISTEDINSIRNLFEKGESPIVYHSLCITGTKQ
jgi:hypothetical protein